MQARPVKPGAGRLPAFVRVQDLFQQPPAEIDERLPDLLMVEAEELEAGFLQVGKAEFLGHGIAAELVIEEKIQAFDEQLFRPFQPYPGLPVGEPDQPGLVVRDEDRDERRIVDLGPADDALDDVPVPGFQGRFQPDPG